MNFEWFLVLAVVVTFVFYLLERLYFKPIRIKRFGKDLAKKRPWWLEWTAGLFWTLLAVLFLRSFIVEPFRIPSGSMLPTLETGDMILVNKMKYNWRIPILDKVFVRFSHPKAGDIVVFRYPKNPSVDYIKRVVAVPGDTIRYANGELFINGQHIQKTYIAPYLNVKQQGGDPLLFETENGGVAHQILHMQSYQERIAKPYQPFQPEQCKIFSFYDFECQVPQGYYFMMGDNRDNSSDSRVWGFVSEDAIIGNAYFIWFNFYFNLGRVGSIQ